MSAPQSMTRKSNAPTEVGIEASPSLRSNRIMTPGAQSASTSRIDAAVSEMQAFLSTTHPTTDAEALQSLRLAFPTVPLSERIAAIKSRFFA